MRLLFLAVCLLFIYPIYGQEEMVLKNRFHEARPGNFIVLEQNKIYTFLNIYEKTDTSLILEEVAVPASRIPKKNFSWKNWFESGGPGNTSWTMSEIDLQKGEIEGIYSFTRQSWLDPAYANTFLSTLLNLKFTAIPVNERKRIGPQPSYGKVDQRPLWNPRLILGGQIYSNVSFSAWKARWPNDRTELARKKIEIYLPEKSADSEISFPTYFPYWIDIEGKLGSAQVKVADSGIDAISPQPPIYRTR